jgi:signal transduction histidine kinase
MPSRIALVASVVVGADPYCALPVAVEPDPNQGTEPAWLRSTGSADPRGDIHVHRAHAVSASSRWVLTGKQRFQLAGMPMGASGKDIGALERHSRISQIGASHRGSAAVPMRLNCITPPIGGGSSRGSDRPHPGRLIQIAWARVMTHKPHQRRGRFFTPRVSSAGGTSDAQVGPPAMGERLLSRLLRPTAGSLTVGIVVAATLIAAETLLVYLLKEVAPGMAFGVVYLLGVLVISTGWGFGLAVTMSVASALAFDYFHERPGSIVPTEAADVVAITMFIVVALAANTLAGVARTRAVEADQRRREADERRREADRAAARANALAELQAALRRVATLVAHGVTPAEVYAAVATELARSLAVGNAAVYRYDADGAALLLAARDEPGMPKMPVGERFSFEGENVVAAVLRTGHAARMDRHDDASGSAAARIRELGLRSGVGAPIVVDGRLWGAAVVGSRRPEPLPPDTEARVTAFADLVATAIASAEARAQLNASRARIVAAADDARRRFERNLHDGAQQRLVSLGLQLRTAETSVPSELRSLKQQISDIVDGLVGVSEEVQEISRGIHPAILSKGGLGPALKTLGRRSTVPVELDLAVDRRLPESVEVAAYYVVAEALTNAAKHARASQVTVRAEAGDANLYLSIRDDGIGGADSAKGSGLTGLIDRVEALGGKMAVSSQPGSGTSLLVEIPVEDR